MKLEANAVKVPTYADGVRMGIGLLKQQDIQFSTFNLIYQIETEALMSSATSKHIL